jgi:hypothetical protein
MIVLAIPLMVTALGWARRFFRRRFQEKRP